MSRHRRLISIFGVVALLLLTVGAAAAKDNDSPKQPHGQVGRPSAGKGKPAHLTWTPGRITQAVTAGQTVQVTATFSSSVDIAEATVVIPGALGRLLKANTTTLTNIKAGALTTVTFTVTMPANGAHTQGGVVQIRAGQRVLARPLHVLLTVANANDTGDDDAAKPAKPLKPVKPNKPAKSKAAHP
jgi:hypothetical protein